MYKMKCIDVAFAIKWHHCENYTQWPWPTFWGLKMCNVDISEMIWTSAKMHGSTFVDFLFAIKGQHFEYYS